MEDHEMLITLFKLSCIGLSIVIFIDFVKRTRDVVRAKFGTFYVKTGFAFERGELLVGALRYYKEADIQKALSENKISLGEYVQEFLPLVSLPFETLSLRDMASVGLPQRIKINADIVEKYGTIAVASDTAFIVINRLGPDPRNCVWFGTCVVSSNKDVMRMFEYRYRKVNKHDPNSYVVRT